MGKKWKSWLRRGATAKPQRRPRKRQPSQLAFTANHKASTASSILQSLLTLYAMVALMHGVVIPISDALAKPLKHAAYRQAFYIFMHGTGIACIVYLNSLISWHQRRAKKRAALVTQRTHDTFEIPMMKLASPEPASALDDRNHGGSRRDDGGDNGSADEPLDNGRPGRHNHDGAEVEGEHQQQIPLVTDDEMAEFDESERRLRAQKTGLVSADEEARRRLEQLEHQIEHQVEQQVEHQVEHQVEQQVEQHVEQSHHYQPAGPRNRLRRKPLVSNLRLVPLRSQDGGEGRAEPPDTPDSPFTPSAFSVSPITQSETGINLYLRLGAIVFGFGVMIHDGFKISEFIENYGVTVCNEDTLFIPKQVIHLLFIMAQTYYVFKHHRVTFNTQLLLIRFMMVHLIVTNLCIWVKTVIYEIKVGLTADAFESSKKQFNSTNSTNISCLEQSMDTGPSHQLGPYLYPCAVEYGLICAAICFKVFSKIGDTKVAAYGRKLYPEGPRFTACHKSHKGLFLGLFIMICILVPMISLQLLQSVNQEHKGVYMLVVLGVECSVLLCTACMSLLGTSKTIRHLKLYKVRGNESFDVNLLFVGLAGIMCYNLFVSISVGSCAVDNNDASHCPRWTGHKNLVTKIAGLKALLEVVQSVAQTLFIMQSIQRRITLDLVTQNHKPGRGITIGLLIANLAMWIEAVFEAKRSFAEDFPQEYFGDMAWSIVKYIFLPLIIFFRFHSSVCLSEIWIHSYKMPKTQGADH